MTGIDVGISEPADMEPPGPGSDAPAPRTTEYRFDDDPPPPRTTRRGRVSKWDRPPPPRDWRWYVGMLGRTLIAVGILMFGFVAYQLWGTGIENAAAQRALENDFEELLDQFEPVAPDPAGALDTDPIDATTGPDAGVEADAGESTDDAEEPPAADPEPAADGASSDATAPAEAVEAAPEIIPAAAQNLPPVENGDAIARIEIPRIGVNDIVVAGVEVGDLKRGPGHFPDTPLPGQLGNAAIAGHRTTYGAPFFEVDQLEAGDEVRVTTLNGVFVYRVTGQEIVSPSAYRVVATTDPTVASLTLVSCHPRYTARQRIIVNTVLDPDASGLVGEPVLNYGRPEEPEIATADEPAELPAGADDPDLDAAPDGADGAEVADSGSSTTGTLAVEAATPDELLSADSDEEIADVFGKGWFSDPAANPHVGFWGLVLTMIAVLAYLLSRRLRRDWVGALVGIVPFIVTLYFFFQNVNRLLPPNL